MKKLKVQLVKFKIRYFQSNQIKMEANRKKIIQILNQISFKIKTWLLLLTTLIQHLKTPTNTLRNKTHRTQSLRKLPNHWHRKLNHMKSHFTSKYQTRLLKNKVSQQSKLQLNHSKQLLNQLLNKLTKANYPMKNLQSSSSGSNSTLMRSEKLNKKHKIRKTKLRRYKTKRIRTLLRV